MRDGDGVSLRWMGSHMFRTREGVSLRFHVECGCYGAGFQRKSRTSGDGMGRWNMRLKAPPFIDGRTRRKSSELGIESWSEE